MNYDYVLKSRALPREKRVDVWLLLSCVLLAAFSMFMFLRAYQFTDSDIHAHANIAADFDFTDLHSITSRLAYPLWHLIVAVIYKLGVPLAWASALVCTACKVSGMLLTHRLLRVMTDDCVHRNVITALSLALMLVMGICIPSINRHVYRPVGSPNVWHNPTQLAVIVTMLLLVPYTMHCWYEFTRARDAGDKKYVLPWRKVLALAVLSMASLACKPTFMQAFLPAAAIFFAVGWAFNIKQWRYFLQIILAFVPAALYFLLQYLYYTGVVVPFTSGVCVLFNDYTIKETHRSVLILSACPLFAVIACFRKGMFKDRQLILCLLMIAVSAAESMVFRETGMRENHGNFYWAGMTASLMLWIEMAGVYTRDVTAYFKSEHKNVVRGVGYALVFILFLWHLGSGLFYPYSIISRGASF